MFYFFTVKFRNFILGLITILFIFSFFIAYCVKENAVLTQQSQGIKVPIIMYHSIVDSKKRAGKYVVTPEILEEDLIYLTTNGYTSILVSDLIDYVYNDKPLPPKPIILSFDDGYYNNLVYIPEIFSKYNAKASIAIVGEFTDKFSKADSHNIYYSHLTWDDLKTLYDTDIVEFSNHTYNMHSTEERFGCFKLKNETNEHYKESISSDILQLQNALKSKVGVNCEVFTYPYGKICNDSVDIIKELGFKASLSCYEKTNIITKDKDCLYLLGRYNRPYGISTTNFMKKNKIY